MKTLKHRAVILALLVFGTVSRCGAETVGMDFLRMDTGIRAPALGGSYCAIAEKAEAVFYNPAGLGLSSTSYLTLLHSSLLSGIEKEVAAVSIHLGNGYMLGCGLLYLCTGLESVDINGTSGPAFEFSDFSATVSLGKRLVGEHSSASLHGGISIKFLKETIETYSASGIAMDTGILFKTAGDYMRIGLCINNIGPGMKFINDPFNLPTCMRFGTAFRPAGSPLLLTADLIRYNYDNTLYRKFGAELSFNGILLLRAGLSPDNRMLGGLSAGFSLMIGELDVEYAYVPQETFGDIQRLGISTELNNILDIWRSFKSLIP